MVIPGDIGGPSAKRQSCNMNWTQQVQQTRYCRLRTRLSVNRGPSDFRASASCALEPQPLALSRTPRVTTAVLLGQSCTVRVSSSTAHYPGHATTQLELNTCHTTAVVLNSPTQQHNEHFPEVTLPSASKHLSVQLAWRVLQGQQEGNSRSYSFGSYLEGRSHPVPRTHAAAAPRERQHRAWTATKSARQTHPVI